MQCEWVMTEQAEIEELGCPAGVNKTGPVAGVNG